MGARGGDDLDARRRRRDVDVEVEIDVRGGRKAGRGQRRCEQESGDLVHGVTRVWSPVATAAKIVPPR
jgi:hypothetical protein